MSIAPETDEAIVGERVWVDVSVRNIGAVAYNVSDGPAHGLAVSLEADRETNWHVSGSLPGTGPTGFRSDADPLRWYLADVPTLPFFEDGRVQSQLDGSFAPTGVQTAPLAPGASRSARFAIDVGPTGPLPSGDHAFLNASVSLSRPDDVRIYASRQISVVEAPDRLGSWLAAVTRAGSDPTTIGWVVDHEGPMSQDGHGCDVAVRYWKGAWELEFFENPTTSSGSSGAGGRPLHLLRVRADATGSGKILEVRELLIGVPPSDDPDASGARPDAERILFEDPPSSLPLE